MTTYTQRSLVAAIRSCAPHVKIDETGGMALAVFEAPGMMQTINLTMVALMMEKQNAKLAN